MTVREFSWQNCTPKETAAGLRSRLNLCADLVITYPAYGMVASATSFLEIGDCTGPGPVRTELCAVYIISLFR